MKLVDRQCLGCQNSDTVGVSRPRYHVPMIVQNGYKLAVQKHRAGAVTGVRDAIETGAFFVRCSTDLDRERHAMNDERPTARSRISPGLPSTA